MAERAQVTSVEAIESFRSSLIVFLSKARPALEEVSSEVQRTHAWLQHDQRRHWENELRLRRRKLDDAQQALFSATLSSLREVRTEEQRAVQRAKQSLDEAEDKLAALKKWDRELEDRSAPLLKLVDQLHGFLTTEMTRAVAYLDQVVRTLEGYAGVTLPGGAARSTESGARPDDVPPAPGESR